VQIRNSEEIFNGRITRILPRLVNSVGAGCMLICHNSQVNTSDVQEIISVFSRMGRVIPVREDPFEAAGELMICAPFILAAMAEGFALAGLLVKEEIPVEEIIRCVATPGGMTEEAIKVFRARLPGAFDYFFEMTFAKRGFLNAQYRFGSASE
jgi:pyrroline-5-carboxylate reductase